MNYVKLSRKHFWIFTGAAVCLLLCGWQAGMLLSGLRHFSGIKLINATGQAYAVLGIVVLAEALAENHTWKSFALTWIAPSILLAHIVIPLGAAVAAAATGAFSRFVPPLAAVVGSSALIFLIWSTPAMALFHVLIIDPSHVRFQPEERRWRWLAFFLLLASGLLQLVAGSLDFLSDVGVVRP